MMMTKEEHRQRHIELHKALDELVADFIKHTEKHLSKTSILEFVQWSSTQTHEPTEED
jgi:hypothetical protein